MKEISDNVTLVEGTLKVAKEKTQYVKDIHLSLKVMSIIYNSSSSLISFISLQLIFVRYAPFT